MTEWKRRTKSGEPRLELFGPDMCSPLLGLFTGPIYLTGLGNTLSKLEMQDRVQL